MFFDDDDRKNKHTVNLGNRGITSKEDFIKKMKEEEKKEKEKKIKDNSKQIIRLFILRNFSSTKPLLSSKVEDNISSVAELLLSSNKLDLQTKEKIALKGIEKTIQQINNFLRCRTVPYKRLFSFTENIRKVLSFISPSEIKKIYNNDDSLRKGYQKMFVYLVKASVLQIYENMKRDYLIDDHAQIFYHLKNLLLVIPNSEKKNAIKYFSKKLSFIYILSAVKGNINKILNVNNKALIFQFICEIVNELIEQRKKYLSKNIKSFSNKVVNSFLETFLIECIAEKDPVKDKRIFFLDLCFTINIDKILDKLRDEMMVKLFIIFIKEVNTKGNFSDKINETHFLFFSKIFEKMQGKDLPKTFRPETILGMNKILELLFKNAQKVSPFNILMVIYNSAKLIEEFYKADFEKTSFQTILDHIVNKIALKVFPELSQIVLVYSVDLLKIIYPNLNENQTYKKIVIKNTKDDLQKNEKLFEIISFFVLNQINYKSNYFFIEFKTTKDIYQNLPFNYYYLNVLSKYLISLFNEKISSANFDELDVMSQNIIIKCLKSLYLLDGEINFTSNREEFWNNMELVSKVSWSSKALLREKMKIIPFIFPLKIRLDLGMREMKKWKVQNSTSLASSLNNNNNFYYGDIEMYEDNDDNSPDEIVIPRASMFETAFTFYLQNNLNPFKKWHIAFIDKFGNREEGIDGGGLYKEFMYKFSEEAFGPKINLFKESATGYLLPNAESYKVSQKHLQMFEFLGFMTAKAIADDIKLYPNISPIFFNNILEIENSFTDLKDYDPELYKNLVYLQKYEGNVEQDFGLTFSITEEDSETKRVRNINLIENGENIPVTNNNRLIYIKKITEYKLLYQYKEQCQKFRDGMQRVLDMEILHLFTGDELRQIIYGFEKDTFDVDDLRANCVLLDNWNLSDEKEVEAINNFFKILHEFDNKEKEKFLFFSTSLKRLPIGGFSKLNPKFRIYKSSSTIPTSSTCANMIFLPIIPYEKMKEALRYVINVDVGFYYS